jgi:hypothetical protein
VEKAKESVEDSAFDVRLVPFFKSGKASKCTFFRLRMLDVTSILWKIVEY